MPASLPAGSSSSPSSSRANSASPPPGASPQRPTFAFAQIKGDVCLVQVPDTLGAPGAMSSALMAADVNVFRHEFITLFRYSHSATVHPADMHILEPIADHCTLYEAEKGTVFLARDVMARMQQLSMDARRPGPSALYPHHQYYHHHYPQMRRQRYSTSPPRMPARS
ncbi:hypothetical protein ONZ51_g7109 [Trametes cubensis]|uniref:Uncharacterized protein n=1 Tax=Trametes cubensis TaxID=1111947 RepID=A0AAD7TTC9_9APHY|nr:hypothetical protein ONZ51_g7109 [Trametes cubensis]